MQNKLSFFFNNQSISYYTNIDKNLQKTERLVELALLEKVLEKHEEDLIEIGCVSPYHFSIRHKVYDLKDTHPLNTKENAKNIKLENKYVISISTIEHFNVNGYNILETDFLDPVEWLKRVLSLSKGYFITFPVGFNKKLDNDLFSESYLYNRTTFLCRLNNSNIWIQKDIRDLTDTDKTYDPTYTSCANSIAIIQNLL